MKEMTATEVLNLLNEGKNLSMIDVREYNEILSGKIPEAKHIPLGEISRRTQELDKNDEHIIICRSGNRSKAAAGLLQSMGFKVVNMTGGMMDWQGEVQ